MAEAIELFAQKSDVAFASHHWPTWGTDKILTLLTEQRDMYAYLHDQTLRLINQGYVHSEIAEMIEMPPGLENAWHAHGYYGSTNHNVKAIYQRYLGWYDGNPAHLWQHPQEAAGSRYVKAFGGVDETVAKAKAFLDEGDLRFAAELASHAVFAEPDNAAAKDLLATVLEQLGYGSENATWRNSFLSGAQELRSGTIVHTEVNSAGLAPALSITQLFDSIAIRINGPKAWAERLSIDWHITDVDQRYFMELSNGALIHFPTKAPTKADVSVSATRPQALGLVMAGVFDGISIEGDGSVLTKLVGLTDEPDPDFAIVTP